MNSSATKAGHQSAPGLGPCRAVALAFSMLLGVNAAQAAAPADGQAPAASAAHGGASAAEIGKKLADPLGDVWALFTEFDYTRTKGDLSGGDTKSGTSMLFQPVMPFKLTENWKMITRPSVPISFSVPVPKLDGQAGIDIKDRGGLGDIALPLLFTPVGGKSLTLGAGPTFVFPTATSDFLGSNTWQAGPAAVVVYKNPKITAGGLGQYWWSYAKTGNNTADTSHGSLLYFLWYNLPHAWQIGTAPTISYDNKATSGNKWNVPVGLMAAKTIKLGKLPIKFQFGVEKSVVRQDGFGKDWMVRLNIIPVIPALVDKPLF